MLSELADAGADPGTSVRMTTTPRALITGITGQDGSYLAELLLEKGYEVVGMVRRSSTVNFERIAHIQDRLTLVSGDLLDEGSMIAVVSEHRPTEIYNLAAQSFVMTSFSQPVLTGDVTALGRDASPRSHPDRRPRHPRVPGELVGDVRQGRGDAADRAHAVLPALSLRRREGLRALDHGELPRELRPLRSVGDPLQPRVAAARASSSSNAR